MSTKAGTKRKAVTAAVGAALIVGGIVGGASPAMAGGNGSTSRSVFHSEASTSTWGGTQGRSYAQHGAVSELTPWYSQSSYAYASTGIWGLGSAWYQFR